VTSPKPQRGSNLGLHFTYGVGMTLCVGAFVVELFRGSDGNSLSWVYVIEWPILGATGTYLWWRLLHDEEHRHGKSERQQQRERLNAAADGASSSSSLDETIKDR